jgi:hypothetical protein
MTPGYVTADFAIKAGYFFVGALVLIFVGMLVLTDASWLHACPVHHECRWNFTVNHQDAP